MVGVPIPIGRGSDDERRPDRPGSRRRTRKLEIATHYVFNSINTRYEKGRSGLVAD